MTTLNADISVFCPCCSQESRSQVFALLSPGNYEWQCPECGESYRITVEFFPREEPS